MKTIPSAETAWIELSAIDLPPNAREHDPAELISLAKDMATHSQLQEIVVTPKSLHESSPPRFEVVAGVGRTLAARNLGWERIRCSVRSGLTEFEKLRITFSENEEREEVSPIYQAQLLKAMIDAEQLTQEELAQRVGKTQARVNQYLQVTHLSETARQSIRRLANLDLAHLNEICRLPTEELQIAFAREVSDNELSVRALRKRVNETLAGKMKRRASKILPVTHIEWRGDAIRIETSFDPRIMNPSVFLLQLRQKIDECLRERTEATTSVETVPQATVTAPASPVANLDLPRLPESERELQDLFQAATTGPGGFYSWVYGAENPLSKTMSGKTWDELGVRDPQAKVKRLLEGLRYRHKAFNSVRAVGFAKPQ